MAEKDKDDQQFHDHFDKKQLKEFESKVEKQVEEQGHAVAEGTITMEGESEPNESEDTDDTAEDGEGSGEKETEETESDHPWEPKKYQMAIGGLLVAVCVSFVAYGVGKVVTRQEHGSKLTYPVVYRAPVGEAMADMIDLARFLVPFPDKDDRAYLLLSILVKPSNPSAYREINERRVFFRGAIYDALKKAVRGSKKKTISGRELKKHVLKALSNMLVKGTLVDIYFSEFLVV